MKFSSTDFILIFLSLFSLLLFGGFALISFHEKERRAGRVATLFTLSTLIIFLAPVFLSDTVQMIIIFITVTLIMVFFILMLIPIGRPEHHLEQTINKIDERDVIFSRNQLVPGTEKFNTYYRQHSDLLLPDNEWRKNPGLLSPNAAFYEPFSFSATSASFSTLAALGPFADGPINPDEFALNPQEATLKIKALAKFLGAMEVGICELNPIYIYTNTGRGAGTYAEDINLDHKFAIAMTFEMNHEMIGANPMMPGVMETGHEYVQSASAAVRLAATIRNLGHPARAHFEGNYQVILPPIARDAGLGEIGRMSLLITPKHGPRVRLSVVTTDLPLIPDRPVVDPSVIDFCNICQKCASTCPSKAISKFERQKTNGALRWVIDPVSCYGYWTKVGTDCGLCMRVCPYAHGSSLHHQVIRWGIRKSGFFRRAALLMDDIFYGKHPKPRKVPTWTSLDPTK